MNKRYNVPNGFFKKPVLLGMVAASLTLLGCGGSHQVPTGGTAVDRAITLFIEGDYVQAERHLNRLTAELEAGEDRRTAYLYLGRTYMALEDYDRAAEAFTTGKLLGGGVRFDEYLTDARRYLGASPATARAQRTVTRGQLAALIHSFLADRLQSDAPSVRRNTSVARTPHVDAVTGWRVMSVLPDGEFHADREVTRSAFFFVLRRLSERLGVAANTSERTLYPHGARSAVATAPTGDGAAENVQFITGNEVVDALRAIVSAASSASTSDPAKD
jgi:tetratricopeptide (TPR) repeat protein